MDKETNLNIDYIYDLLKEKDTDHIIKKIDELEKNNSQNIVLICNKILSLSQEPSVLMYCIQVMDKYRNSSTLEYLVDILLLRNAKYSDEQTREKFVKVRIMAAKAIANQKNTSIVSSLLYCLNNKDENYRVRLACADALGRIGDKYAVAPLIEVVKDEDEKSVYLRESAVSALGLLGDTRAIEPLVSIIETKQSILNKFTFLKERAIEALSKMGFGDNERVFKAMKEALSDESTQVRINAIEAIMESENPQAYEVIKHCLETDTDVEVKKNAMTALYNLSDRSILDEVINSPNYPDELKMEAVSIIEEYEDEQ